MDDRKSVRARGRPMLVAKIEQISPDDHVWITVECKDRPTVSIDIGNQHGRRYMSVRLDGMTHQSMLLDTAHLPPRSGDEWMEHRFCPFCGEEIIFVSARGHVCSTSEGDTA